MVLWDKEGRKKGEEGENKFKEWLDKHKIPYLYIRQNPRAFSSVFKDKNLKRPDFMILLPNLGFIMIDIKNKPIRYGENFALDTIETKKFSKLQREFNLPMWFVISNKEIGYKTWYWIPISKVFEEGRFKEERSHISKQPFFIIPLEEFIQIADDDSLERLFSKSF